MDIVLVHVGLLIQIICVPNLTDAVTANVPKYLKWLLETFKSLGGRIERQSVESIEQVIGQYQKADIVINCTGLGSSKLKDVEDTTLCPLRGQTVLVHAPHIKVRRYG